MADLLCDITIPFPNYAFIVSKVFLAGSTVYLKMSFLGPYFRENWQNLRTSFDDGLLGLEQGLHFCPLHQQGGCQTRRQRIEQLRGICGVKHKVLSLNNTYENEICSGNLQVLQKIAHFSFTQHKYKSKISKTMTSQDEGYGVVDHSKSCYS